MAAVRLWRGLSEVTGDVVLPVLVGRALEDPLVGLAVRRDGKKNIGADRVVLLVRGTNSTHMETIEEAKTMAGQIIMVLSAAADCRLSEPPAQADLAGECDLNKMLRVGM